MYCTLRIAAFARRLRGLAVLACLLLLPRFAPAQTIWAPIVGGDYKWGTASNWSTGVVPNDASTDVTIGTAFVYLNMDATVRNLITSQYIIASGGTRNLSVAGQLTWTGGWMTNAGTTTLNGASSISANGSCGLGSARAVVNNGSASFNGSSYLNADPGVVWTNNGTFAFTSDNAYLIRNVAPPLPIFVNTSTGILAKTAGTGTNRINWTLDNAGTIDIQSGTLRFENGGMLRNGGRTTGAGTFLIQQADDLYYRASSLMTVGTAASDVFTFGSNVRLDAGMELTGPGKMVFNGNFDWVNGTLSGSGATELNGSNNRMRSNDLALSRAVLNNGTASLEGGITVTGSGTASWTNTGTFNFTGDGTLAGSQTFINASTGVLAKTGGTGTSTVNWTVDNAGLIRGDSGTLQLAGGFSQSSTGRIVASSGAAVSFASPISIEGGLAGGGTINAGAINHSNGWIAPGISAGTLTINGNLSLASTSVLNFELGSSTASDDKLVVNGNLTLPSSATPLTLNIFGTIPDMYARTGERVTLIDYSGTLTGGASSFVIGSTPTPDKSQYWIEIDPVNTQVLLRIPEPSTVVLGTTLGLMGLILAWRKRKAAR